jgi:hypothetical protein
LFQTGQFFGKEVERNGPGHAEERHVTVKYMEDLLSSFPLYISPTSSASLSPSLQEGLYEFLGWRFSQRVRAFYGELYEGIVEKDFGKEMRSCRSVMESLPSLLSLL